VDDRSDVLRFLRHDVASVRQLETLLLVRANAPRAWTAEQVNAELQSGLTWTRRQLDGLHAKGLLEVRRDPEGPPAFRYAPTSGELATVVDAVAELFARRRTRVIELIFGGHDG
jgi:hypothetical protein